MTIQFTPPIIHEAGNGGTSENGLEGADGVAADVRKDAPCARYRPDGFLNMDAARLKDLDWKAEVPLDEMFRRLVEWMR